MWKRLERILLRFLLGLCTLAVPAGAAGPAEQQSVTVLVVNALPQPPQPVNAVRVSLSYLDSSVTVTKVVVTNPQGEALLEISADAAARGDFRVEVAGSGDLAIYQPADGQLPALPAKLTIKLLPKGSPALLEPAQIEAMLRRTLMQLNRLQKQAGAPKQSEKPDLGPSISEWAEANGFSANHVNQQVQQWAEAIQDQPGRSTAEQRALAELALKHYGNAAQLFSEAGDADRKEINSEDAQQKALAAQVNALQAGQQALLGQERNSLRRLLDHSQQAASAEQLNLQYHEATQTLEAATDAGQAEYKEHAADRGFHELWLRALASLTDARRREGEISPASQSLPLLAQSADDFRLLAREHADLGDRADVAAAQKGLGRALMEEGERASADKAPALFDQAMHAYQNALEVFTKADLPLDWARTQTNLGYLFIDEGERASGDKAPALFDQAIQAFKRSLEVFTKADLPQDWANAQNSLGITLAREGERAGGDKAPALLDQAVEAFQHALEVRSKAGLPQDWAMTQNNLGITLVREAERATGERAISLFDQAVQAFGHALEVFTKADVPQDWAAAQNGLGVALMEEAERTSGDKAAALFGQAVQAFQHVLEVNTKADLPQSWAMTQINLGAALSQEADRASGDKAAALFDQAVDALQHALEVDTKADVPHYWAMVQNNLGDVFRDEGERASGDKAAALFDQAIQAFQHALEVYTKASLPQYWAGVEMDLGTALTDAAEGASGDKAGFLFDQAVQAFEHALEVFTKADPEDWAMAHTNLTDAYLLSARFGACVEQTGVLADSALPPNQAIIRDTLKLACQWGSGNKTAALATDKVLLTEAATPAEGFWSSTTTLHFLSASPVFEQGRASWVALFTAVQNGDSAGITAALKQLEPLFKN